MKKLFGLLVAFAFVFTLNVEAESKIALKKVNKVEIKNKVGIKADPYVKLDYYIGEPEDVQNEPSIKDKLVIIWSDNGSYTVHIYWDAEQGYYYNSSKEFYDKNNNYLKSYEYGYWINTNASYHQNERERKEYNKDGYLVYKENTTWHNKTVKKGKIQSWWKPVYKSGYSTFTKEITYYYNDKGKMWLKYIKNKNDNFTYKEERQYYDNDKTLKVKSYYYLTGKEGKYQKITSAKYYKYHKSGKKSVEKTIPYKNGYPTKQTTIKYNKKGQKKSNKNGKAYKYVVTYKKNSLSYKKVTKAQYNKKGKLGKAKKIKPTYFATHWWKP